MFSIGKALILTAKIPVSSFLAECSSLWLCPDGYHGDKLGFEWTQGKAAEISRGERAVSLPVFVLAVLGDENYEQSWLLSLNTSQDQE